MKKLLLGAVACFAWVPLALADAEFIWGVTGAQGAASSLYAINPDTGELLGRVGSTDTVNLTGIEVKNGVLYAVQGQLSPAGASNKHLYRIDKKTGKAAEIATLASKYAISDLALRPTDGVMYGFGVSTLTKKLLTIDLTTGAITEIGAKNDIPNVSLTFGLDGTLYLVRTNGLFTMNPATGAVITGPFALSGANTQIDNFMATRSNGTIYCGLRTNGGTELYTLNPATQVLTRVGTVAGVALSGIAFDRTPRPVLKLKGKKTITTTKTTVKLKGTATSLVPLRISTKGASTVAKSGKWTLKVKARKPRNVFRLTCDDGLGQRASAKAIVLRK